MNKHSLFFAITLFFGLALVLINALFWVQLRLLEKDEIFRDQARIHRGLKAVMDGRMFGENPKQTAKALENLGLSRLEFSGDLLQKGRLIDRDRGREIYLIEDRRHFVLYPPPHIGDPPLVLRDDFTPSTFDTTRLIVLGINVVLTLFVLFLFKKLQPLRQLKDEIRRFGAGEPVGLATLRGKDEIAEVANEFGRVATKAQALENSRSLFVRNILHELNTPVAKGKIATDMLPASREQARLIKVFTRMKYLLSELTKLERFTSGNLSLNRRDYRLIDLLDQALDILLIEPEQIEVSGFGGTISADYELFAIALKNLIDNALRYGENKPRITLEEKTVIVESKGKPLEKPFEHYLRPFNRPYEDSGRGLGLGLYITRHILSAHGFTLGYERTGEFNRFTIGL